MTRVITQEIKSCSACPYCKAEITIEEGARRFCIKQDKKVTVPNSFIHKDCPLPALISD